MVEGRFYCQLKFKKRGQLMKIGQDLKEVFHGDDIVSFVKEQRPTLKDKIFQIEFTEQRI